MKAKFCSYCERYCVEHACRFCGKYDCKGHSLQAENHRLRKALEVALGHLPTKTRTAVLRKAYGVADGRQTP
jgi:hypothetical protein